jgi:REase_DpnII-MboI
LPAHVTSIDIAALIRESEDLDQVMGEWQTNAPSLEELKSVRRRYRSFLALGKQVLAPDKQADFQKQYDGSFTDTDIGDFLADPVGRSPLFSGSDYEGTELSWKVGFKTHVAPKLAKQRDLLEEARVATSDPENVLTVWASTFRRLPSLIRTLGRSNHPDQVPPVHLADEKGLQDLLEAILRLHFDDVRREEAVPHRAGAASFVDFLIPEIGLAIEVKMTRPTLMDKKVGEELLTDAGRYPAHPDCEAVLAIIYDPGHYLRNPHGLEADLSKPTSSGAPMRAIVVN